MNSFEEFECWEGGRRRKEEEGGGRRRKEEEGGARRKNTRALLELVSRPSLMLKQTFHNLSQQPLFRKIDHLGLAEDGVGQEASIHLENSYKWNARRICVFDKIFYFRRGARDVG
jgi:hypothetical protein